MNKKPESQILKASHPIKLVIFDCDGVLVDSEVISVEVLLAELKAIDVDVGMDYFYEHFLGRSFSHVKAKILESYGVELAADFEANYQQRLLVAFETRLQPTPGVRTIVEQMGTSYCVATSSSPKRTESALKLTGLNDLFADNVFTASQVNNGKPAPDLLLFAAEKMGVKPEHCLVIEDSLAGLQAAQAAGMLVWHYLGGSHIAAFSHFASDFDKTEEYSQSTARFSSWQKFYKMAANLKQAS